MKYRPLGRTGLVVSEIGFGCWGIGGVTAGATSYGEVDDAASLNALDRANYDIAYAYASRLRGEPAAGVGDVHFHPAEPRTWRVSATRRF